MIVINVQFLIIIGMANDEAYAIAADPASGGLAVSHIFSFGGGGDRRSFDEAKASGATSLILVGMADRYGSATTLGITPRQLCVAEFSARKPTIEEAEELGQLLASCTHPAASRISDLTRQASALA